MGSAFGGVPTRFRILSRPIPIEDASIQRADAPVGGVGYLGSARHSVSCSREVNADRSSQVRELSSAEDIIATGGFGKEVFSILSVVYLVTGWGSLV